MSSYSEIDAAIQEARQYEQPKNWGEEEFYQQKQREKSNMSVEHTKGKVTDIFKSNEKNDEQYGKSANLKITLDAGPEYSLFYNYGKNGDKPEPVKIGDEIEFDWVKNEKYGTKDILHRKDNYTLKNLTNPDAIPEKKAFGGGFKSDPGRDIRMCYQSVLNNVCNVMMHNRPGTQIKPSDFEASILPLTEKLVKRIYAFKLPETAVAPVVQEVLPIQMSAAPVTAVTFPDEDIPF